MTLKLRQAEFAVCEIRKQSMHRVEVDLETFFDHSLPASTAFLSWLEEELHSALQITFLLFQQLGASKQHGHVAVMSARM